MARFARGTFQPMRRAVPLLLAYAAFSAGCYDWRGAVTHTAGFEHNCPEERVQICGDDGNGMARSVQLDVCGERRIYRDVGGRRMFLWVDATGTVNDSAGGGSTPSAPPPSASPRAAWTDDEVSALIAELNGPIVACAGWRSVAISMTLDAAGRLRDVRGFSEESEEVRRCIVGVTSSMPPRGLRSGSRRFRARFEQRINRAVPARDDAPSTEAAVSATRARITERGPQILACVGEAFAAVEASWSAGDSTMTIAVQGQLDPVVVDCVRAAVGPIPVPPGESGRVLHAVSL